jgi:hypothetical protein
MANVGIDNPSVLDLVTLGEDACRLVLVQERRLRGDDAPALQEKLNNYLRTPLMGLLAETIPTHSTNP